MQVLVCRCDNINCGCGLTCLQRQMKSRDGRIEELEEALRESVSITAEREMVLTKESETRHALEKQVHALGRLYRLPVFCVYQVA